MKRELAARFDQAPCPIARVSAIVGERWTLLVLRQCFYGTRRYDDFVQALGIPRPILTKRLSRLLDEGILEKRQYEAHPPRWEYRLTNKGRAFYDVLAAMWRWGLDWQWANDDPPLVLRDRETGAEVDPVVVDENTGARLDVRRLHPSVRTSRARRRADAAPPE